MYRKLFLITASSLALVACSSSSETTQQEDKSTSATQEAICEPVQSMSGSWQPADVSKEAKQAAVLAAASMQGNHSLEEIISVDKQMDTETNYRISFIIESGEIYTATVFRNVAGQYQLLAVQPKSLVDQCNANQES